MVNTWPPLPYKITLHVSLMLASSPTSSSSFLFSLLTSHFYISDFSSPPPDPFAPRKLTLVSASSFQNFTLGSIDSQQGWTVRTSLGESINQYDQAIKDANGIRVWQMSNAITMASSTDQPYSSSTAQVAGEAGSSLWNDYGPTLKRLPLGYGANATTSTFYMRVNFTSATVSLRKISSWTCTRPPGNHPGPWLA